MKSVGIIIFKYDVIEIRKNDRAKFFVYINGKVTQKELTAEEIVRYLMNAMEGIK